MDQDYIGRRWESKRTCPLRGSLMAEDCRSCPAFFYSIAETAGASQNLRIAGASSSLRPRQTQGMNGGWTHRISIYTISMLRARVGLPVPILYLPYSKRFPRSSPLALVLLLRERECVGTRRHSPVNWVIMFINQRPPITSPLCFGRNYMQVR